MAGILTPRQLSRRSDFYQQLAQMVSSGVGIIPALELLQRNPPDRSLHEPIARVVRSLNAGARLAEGLRSAGRWLPEFDLALIEAAEQSGRAPEIFRLLAAHYRERAALARTLIVSLAYPAVLLHMLILVFPIGRLTGLVVQGDVTGFLFQKALVLGPLYALVWLLVFLSQSRRGATWRSLLESLLHPIPVLGRARRSLALARLSAALEALINAGVPIVPAWALAGEASGSFRLRESIRRFLPQLESGNSPSEQINHSGAFPEVFASQYHAGEVSGRLDESLERLHEYYQEEGTRLMRMAVVGGAGLIYGLVMVLVAFYVLNFWLNYFGQLNSVL